jgi:hypothetical protein
VSVEVVEQVLSRAIDELEPTLTRNGYDAPTLTALLNASPAYRCASGDFARCRDCEHIPPLACGYTYPSRSATPKCRDRFLGQKSRRTNVPRQRIGGRGGGPAMMSMHSLLCAICCLLVTGCGTLGPATVPNDQVDYADAMSRGDARLALLNIVKLRYQDVVTFLGANQVVAGYQLQGQINLNGQLARIGDSGALGVQGTFSNNPTITYSPVTGGDFETLLLTPIPPLDLFALANSGSSTAVVLSVGLEQFNGVTNPGIGLAPGESDRSPNIRELIRVGEALRQAHRLSVDVETTGKGKDRTRVLVYNFAPGKPDPELDREERRWRQILGLDPKIKHFQVVYGSGRGGPGEIRVVTRSIMAILVDVARGIEVPTRDIAEGRTTATPADFRPVAHVIIHSTTGLLHPSDAATYVRYRDRWFWIDDKDYQSKSIFAFIVHLLSLAEGEKTQQLPVITIPVG